MSSLRFLLFLAILIPLFISSSSSSSSSVDENGIAPTSKLVDSICKQTSNYTFCVESIYTDPRAPKAHDYFLLAYISFGLAYLNSTDTLSYIKHLLAPPPPPAPPTNNNTNSPDDDNSSSSSNSLQRCSEDYEKAVSALEEAYNDLNSETYFDLKVLANSASHHALHCQHNFKGGKGKRRRREHSNTIIMNSLTKRNNDLRGLCEICVLVSNQFS